MADNRGKAVLAELADLYSRSSYAIDIVDDLREPLGLNDSIDVPSIGQLTVSASGAGTIAAQAVTTSALTVLADRHPFINAALPSVDQIQLMGGQWAPKVAAQATQQLKNRMDEDLCRDYLARTLAYDTAATYHDNLSAVSLTSAAILNAKANMLAQDGVQESNLAMIVSSFGAASLANVAGVQYTGAQLQPGQVGIPKIAEFFGMPIFMTPAVQRSLTIAGTGTITSNVATVTVAAGHGFVPGAMLYTSGFTVAGGANIAVGSAVAVTSVTATTVTFPLTGTNGSIGSGSIIMRSSMNLLIDRAGIHVAQQVLPRVRVVADPTSSADNLQVSSIWGRIGRPGRCRVLHSPYASA